MPGKIFINETADKQKVELTTGADGISGGYYDAAGVWHDLGGSAPSSKIYKLKNRTASGASGSFAFPALLVVSDSTRSQLPDGSFIGAVVANTANGGAQANGVKYPNAVLSGSGILQTDGTPYEGLSSARFTSIPSSIELTETEQEYFDSVFEEVTE